MLYIHYIYIYIYVRSFYIIILSHHTPLYKSFSSHLLTCVYILHTHTCLEDHIQYIKIYILYNRFTYTDRLYVVLI